MELSPLTQPKVEMEFILLYTPPLGLFLLRENLKIFKKFHLISASLIYLNIERIR